MKLGWISFQVIHCKEIPCFSFGKHRALFSFRYFWRLCLYRNSHSATSVVMAGTQQNHISWRDCCLLLTVIMTGKVSSLDSNRSLNSNGPQHLIPLLGWIYFLFDVPHCASSKFILHFFCTDIISSAMCTESECPILRDTFCKGPTAYGIHLVPVSWLGTRIHQVRDILAI